MGEMNVIEATETPTADSAESAAPWFQVERLVVRYRLNIHIPWLSLVIFPQILFAYFSAGSVTVAFHAASVLWWVFFPCQDKNFGKGKRLDWIRKSVFICGTFAVLVAGIRFT